MCRADQARLLSSPLLHTQVARETKIGEQPYLEVKPKLVKTLFYYSRKTLNSSKPLARNNIGQTNDVENALDYAVIHLGDDSSYNALWFLCGTGYPIKPHLK